MRDRRAGAAADRRSRVTLVRAVAFAGTGAVAVALATLHPLGILLGAGAWGLLAPTLRRGVAYGAAFSLVVLAAFALSLSGSGDLAPLLGAGPLAAAPVAIAVALGVVGGLARGLR
ncbi:hypothetical protein [Haloparvum sedimenti]|uniref:hypothetical protein n=1 Tax=Haloparvum sedimenti TaxID=1678448 RepID=UPI00071E87CC|nr:hypothetical protein [Haloparvum sedimenti]